MLEIKIKYPIIAEEEQNLRQLAASLSEEIVIDVPDSKGDFVDELNETVKKINEFRVELVSVIEKTANALNNTIVSFKKADSNISYRE